MNDRRKLLVPLGAGVLASAAPRVSFAQPQGKVWRVGFLSPISASLNPQQIGAFVKGMRDLGYVEGGNLIVEWRFADGNLERLPGLAAEMVRLNVDVIVADASPAIRAAQKATTTIPIVMASTGDPVGSGFVKSLARPEGNITGLALMSNDVSAKLLDLLRALAPQLSRVAVLGSPSSSTWQAILSNVQAAAKTAGIEVVSVEAQTPQDIESGFAMMARSKVEALLVGLTPFFVQQQQQIVQLAVKHRLPSIAGNRGYAEAGGLMSYGQNIADNFRRAATYVDKILRGAKAGELPVEQPATLEFVLNLRTAKALGLTIPQSLLLRADEVIR